MDLVTKQEAKEKNLVYYYTGKPCLLGHYSARYAKSGHCRECTLLRCKDNRERMRETARDWQRKNKDKVAQYGKKNVAKNYEKNLERQAKWRENNRQYASEWAKNNRDKCNAILQNRRAKQKESGGKFNEDDILRIKEAQGNKCAVCMIKLNKYHIDHIIPLTKQGTNEPKNLQILCPPCNRSKGNKMPEDFMRLRGFLI